MKEWPRSVHVRVRVRVDGKISTSYLIFCQLQYIILSWNTTELQGRLATTMQILLICFKDSSRKRVYSIIASAKNTAVEKEGGLRVDLCFLSLCFYRILFWNTWTHFFNFQSFLLILNICYRVLLILENNWIFMCVF